jgi:beta-glucosidase
MTTSFPPDFAWGTATSAYQIEGGRTDGKGESIWDRFAATADHMPDTGDVACDHYNRWREDVALMAELGVNAYRFSLAWTRLLPDGDGEVSKEGIAFYSDLVDELLANGITPWVTLYHWDLPQALQDRGGWPERATVDAFVRYAEVAAEALGDRVSHWITHNEPWVAAMIGHQTGRFAPGMADWGAALATSHHLLLSHGRATQVLREADPDAEVGIALDCRVVRPASDDPADVAACRHFDGFRNRWFFDPVFGRGYPEDVVEAYRERGRLPAEGIPFVHDGDLEEIAAPIDFLGLNYYTSLTISAGADEDEETGVPRSENPPPGHTEMGWPITPGALTEFLQRLHADYAPPRIVITENGASYSDGPDAEGRVRDDRRIAYLREHLAAVADAIEAGVPVGGYFVWSLMDNLEWTSGYSQRFGLIWVDHTTQERILKDSARWYGDVARAGALPAG